MTGEKSGHDEECVHPQCGISDELLHEGQLSPHQCEQISAGNLCAGEGVIDKNEEERYEANAVKAADFAQFRLGRRRLNDT